MKNLLSILLLLSFFACSKMQIGPTKSVGIGVPWNDSSNRHPKNDAFKTLIEKYRTKGLPGISLLVNDPNGTWVGATGKADIGNNIDFVPGTVSKAASITKLFMGALMFKLFEDSANTGLGYSSLSKPINTWIPHRITDKIGNGNIITLGQLMKHESGISDIIEDNSFYLAVLNKSK